MIESIIPNPNSLPYILKDELLNFYITFKGQLDKPVDFTLSYRDSMNDKVYKSDIKIDPSVEN